MRWSWPCGDFTVRYQDPMGSSRACELGQRCVEPWTYAYFWPKAAVCKRQVWIQIDVFPTVTNRLHSRHCFSDSHDALWYISKSKKNPNPNKFQKSYINTSHLLLLSSYTHLTDPTGQHEASHVVLILEILWNMWSHLETDDSENQWSYWVKGKLENAQR